MTRTTDDPIFGPILRHARRDGARVAFELVRESGVVRLTRAGLARRLAHLGEAFRAHGLGEGRKIAIAMENRPAWAVVHLGAWYAGAVTVPLDPQLEPAKLGRIIAHSGAAAVVTSARHREAIARAIESSAVSLALFDVDRDPVGAWDGAVGFAETAPPVAPGENGSLLRLAGVPPAGEPPWRPARSPDGLGMIVYTSGTTGDPKGVMLDRDGIAENIRAALARVRCDETDSVLGVLPLFHVFALLANCVGPAIVGARAVFLEKLDPEAILAAFREREITLFACVPLFFYRFHERVHASISALGPFRRGAARALIALCRLARRRLHLRLGRALLPVVHRPFGPSLRLFVTGGARFDPDVYEELLDWGFRLVQAYGLTEATAVLTITPLGELRGDSVGKPIEGVTIEIREPGPDGVGEIVARGPSLMRGYYRDERATRAALEDGWLHTGDLGRIAPDGHLQVTGRAKDVIVLASGKNVYPAELDEHFARCPFAKEVCIVGVRDETRRGAERLHAVVVPDLDEARRRGYVNVREMIRWELDALSRNLPAWQRPTSVSFRQEPLPRTTTRKVRRFEVRREAERVLAEERAEAGRPEAPQRMASPVPDRGPEAVVYRLLAARAGRTQVSAADHLDLDLGLDSLDRVDVIAEAARRLGVEPPPELAATAHLAGELAAGLAGAPAAAGPEVGTGEEQARWDARLGEAPAEFAAYLRRGPLRDTLLRGVRRLGRLAAPLAGGLRVAGADQVPREAPVLVCPNHTSHLDAFVTLAALPAGVAARAFFVGYAEYFEGPLGRLVSRLARNIPVDQNRHTVRSLQAAAEGLRRGLALIAFPEGGRSIDGTLQPFRRGPAILARHTGAPIVPAGIWGAERSWPRGGHWRRHPLAVAFGPPIDPHRDARGIDELTALLRRRVAELREAAAALWTGAKIPDRERAAP